MFIHKKSQFELTKVLALVHVFLACVFLPLAVSGDQSVPFNNHSRSAQRVPALSFRIIEGGSHGGLPTRAHPVSHRRSHHHAVNNDENYILRRVPVTSRRRVHYRRANVNENRNINENTNVNVNYYGDADSNVYKDEIPFDSFQDIDNTNERAEKDPIVIKLETKLYASITFRANIIVVFGQMLKAPNNKLTVDQFTSLNLILQTLIHKRVYIFNLLPILKKLHGANKQTQFKLVMQALANNVPVYMVSACKFWMNEIEKHYVDVEELFGSIDQQPDFLTGIDPEVIDTCKVKVAAEELEPFDDPSQITGKTLGPVFVNIFNMIKNHRITLSQKLFGAILMNLPIGKLNPVLEEYINYIWDVMQDSLLSNWDDITPQIEYGNPYEIVNSVVKNLLKNGDTPDVVKHALKYILLHLKKVPSTFSDKYHTDMQMLLKSENKVALMLSMIRDDLTIPELSDLRDRLIGYIKQININDILQGLNQYTYEEPFDLLIALLVRIQGRTQNKDIRDTVTKLMSILISKKNLGFFTVTVPADVDLVMLLDFLNLPDSNPAISALGQKIQNYLESDLNLLSNLQDLVLKEDKSKCYRPIQCLLNVFTETIKPNIAKQLGVPSNLIAMIQKLVDLIKNAISSSTKCEPNDLLSAERPENPDDSINPALQPIVQSPGSTTEPVLLQSSNPTIKPTNWAIPPLIPVQPPVDYDETIFKPDYPNSQSTEVVEVIYPTYPDDKVEDSSYPTLPIKDVKFPDGWVVQPIDIELLKPNLKPTLLPNPGSKPRPTAVPTSITQIIQALKPSVIPSVKPVIEPSIPSPISPSKKPPVVIAPSQLPTKKPPAKYPPNNLTPQAENEPVLPPNLSFDRPMYVVFPKGDEPPHTLATKPNGTLNEETFIEFPSIKELLQGFNPNTPFSPNELPDMPEILEPLKKTLGPNFIEEILGKHVEKAEYPTVISLMDDVLDHALDNPKVMANPKLVLSIQLYLKGIDYVSTAALFPVVIDSQKIPSDVLYVTFNPDNPNANSVDSVPPQRIPAGFMTLPIFHPKYWVQQVDPLNPYGTLLPSTNGGEDNPIQDLIDDGSLQETLGPDFDPLLYLNKGTLLTTVLQKLIVSKRVISDPWLLKKLNAYLKSIRAVALYSKIPNDYDTHILALQQNNEVNWQPDTASLIMALPPARTHHQSNKIKLIKSLLETPNLLELLQINNPPYSTTRGAFLKMIFNAALRSKKMALDPKTYAALIYYESKILMKGNGALPIVWVWVQMFIIREEVPLGEIIETVLDYDSLPHKLKISYNDLMTYLSENPQFLQGNDNFAFDKYPTKGTFLKGLFTHFLTKPDIGPKAKMQLKQLIPHIKLTGHGAEPMNHVTIDDITNGEIDKNRYSVLLNG